MDLRAWREKRTGQTFVTPSGLTVTLKPVTVYDLAMRGEIPAPLTGAMNDLISHEQVLTVDALPKFGEAAKVVVAAALVEPLVGEETDETHIRIDELSAMDIIQIYLWAVQEVQALVPFRAEAEQPGGAGPAGDAVRAAAE